MDDAKLWSEWRLRTYKATQTASDYFFEKKSEIDRCCKVLLS